MSRGRKSFGLLLAAIIAVGGIFFPSERPLTGSQGNRPGLAGGWASAGVRVAPHGLVAAATDTPRQPSAAYGRLPLAFEANRGQTDPQVKFLTRTGRHVVFLTPTEAVLVLTTGKGKRKDDVERASRSPSRPEAHAATVVRMQFAGANPAPQVTGLEALPGTANYFIGNDRAKWHTNVPMFARVHYAEVYPGIDLSFYGAAPEAGERGARGGPQHLEYDFVVRPGGDPSTIALDFQGAEALDITGQGDLVLQLPDGGTLSQPKPVVYQMVNGVRRAIAGAYVRRTAHRIGFRGNAYVTGRTQASDFPTAGDAVQPAFSGKEDAFVAKIAPNGNNSTDLVYSTFLGGNFESVGYGIAVGPSGCAYVTGATSSTNFPLAGAFQTAKKGVQNAFVTKLSADGSARVYSTYPAGSLDADGDGIAVFTAADGSEYAFVTGSTESTDFPTAPTPGAYQPALKGVRDAFVTVFAPDGTALVYSTYLGGDAGSTDATGIAVNGSGDAYVTGETNSLMFPTTPGAYQTANSGSTDAFVTKLAPAGNGSADLLYSTYLGGTLGESGNGIAVDGLGNAYVTGGTDSPNFPTKEGFEGWPGDAGRENAFVAEIAPNGGGPADLLYSSYLGGFMDDYGAAIAVDSSGHAYVTGVTSSDDFPTTPDAFQVTSPGLGPGFENGFVAKISQTQPPCNSPCNPTDPPGVGGSGGPPPADPPALPPVPSLPPVP